MIRIFAALAVLGCCAVAVLPAGAASRPKDLWATVNVCDTEVHQNMMGVRASMPGDAEHTKMYMRFVAQYYERSKQLWSEVKGSGVSKWISVGSGDFARRQGGFTFAFDPPASGKTFVLRGAVDFKWTKGRRIVRTAHVLTKSGHPGTKGADPKDYSAGLCEIT
ncbi:MAG: hypothetical protein QOJ29_2475 [Thermoleophilaceae bacterium]|jgi:hypothetical protein|nr:hypothetical protein [Thermoleophilaceae bacterium]